MCSSGASVRAVPVLASGEMPAEPPLGGLQPFVAGAESPSPWDAYQQATFPIEGRIRTGRRRPWPAAWPLGGAAVQEVTVHPQSRVSFLSGLALYEARPDKGYRLTDCISMETMRAEGISGILTHDNHFMQEGFTILL
jgi:hypothetical protein